MPVPAAAAAAGGSGASGAGAGAGAAGGASGASTFATAMQGAQAGGGLISDLFGGFVIRPIQAKKIREMQEKMWLEDQKRRAFEFAEQQRMATRNQNMNGIAMLGQMREGAISSQRGKVFRDGLLNALGGTSA